MREEKERLRKLYKSKRAALSLVEKTQYSFQILHQFKIWVSTRPALTHFHLFLPIVHLHEINTYIIKEFLESSQKKVYTSVIHHGIEMQTVALDSDTKYEVGKFGVPVPISALEADHEILEVVLVPLLAFDRAGNRIGFGKGYYDVFLSHLRPEVIKLGLSYFSPEEEIPSEAHDKRLDFCLTKDTIFRF